MFSHAFHPIPSGPSYLTQIDPRARIAAALILRVVALAKSVPAMGLALAVAGGLVLLARFRQATCFAACCRWKFSWQY